MLLSECDIGCYSDGSEKSSAPATAPTMNAKGDNTALSAAVFVGGGGGGYIDSRHTNLDDDDDDDDNRIG